MAGIRIIIKFLIKMKKKKSKSDYLLLEYKTYSDEAT